MSLLLFLALFFFQPPLWIWNVLLTWSPHPDSRGNASADAMAKNSATRPAQPLCLMYSHIHDTSPTSSHWHAVFCHSEKCLSRLSSVTCHHSTSTWIGPNEKPWLVHHFSPHFAILTHVSQGGMLKEINENWFITGFISVAQKCCEACLICISNNPGNMKMRKEYEITLVLKKFSLQLPLTWNVRLQGTSSHTQFCVKTEF